MTISPQSDPCGKEIRACSGVIFAAGGSSTRFGGNKLFAPLGGMPLFCHALKRFSEWLPPNHCVLVVPLAEMDNFSQIIAEQNLNNIIIAEGGATRFHSVASGLRSLPKEISLVAVQDAARPLTSLALLQACLQSARECGSGVAAHRVVDTIKTASTDGMVIGTPDRQSLWAAETPQAFRREWLEAAYGLNTSSQVPTDDAQAVQNAGFPVKLVENHEPNLKVTYPADLELAVFLLRSHAIE